MNSKQLFILALIILGTISLVLMIIFLSASLKDRQITEKSAELISGIIIALIAVVSFIMGKKIDK